ncbi:methyltransferase [Candidatus Bathyarchaeota archaeon]|nr:methyltransferase [Candidatus Bathyarchaeota archaeon]
MGLRKTIKEYLQDKVPNHILEDIPSSFDILGSREKSVALIEIPEEVEGYDHLIAEAIMEVHKNVESVLSKESGRQGEYRLRELEVIAGNPNTEVIHKESGCRFKLDPMDTYFSTRESTERERITNKVISGEDILVMFSGVGPFAVCIAKNHPTVKITCIEINPKAHNYCLENIKLNKIQDQVTPILGDVREICPQMDKKFDRVLMPLPKGASEFLDIAVPMVKNSGILHFYHWAHEDDLWSEAEKLVREEANKHDKKVEFIDHQEVSLYSPRVYKIRVDGLLY